MKIVTQIDIQKYVLHGSLFTSLDAVKTYLMLNFPNDHLFGIVQADEVTKSFWKSHKSFIWG